MEPNNWNLWMHTYTQVVIIFCAILLHVCINFYNIWTFGPHKTGCNKYVFSGGGMVAITLDVQYSSYASLFFCPYPQLTRFILRKQRLILNNHTHMYTRWIIAIIKLFIYFLVASCALLFCFVLLCVPGG